MTFVYFILVLGVTIFIHELGHFLFAKKNHIYVYEFSLGMGPHIFKFKRKNDETVYGVRLFPIGGFVQLAGEDVEDDDDIPSDQVLTNKPWHQKFFTIAAGVLFNFLLAIVIFFIVALFGGASDVKPYVGEVPVDTPAYKAGLPANSLILKINGISISTIDRFSLEYQVGNGKDLVLEVRDQEGTIKNVTIKPEKTTKNDKTTYQYGFTLTSKAERGLLASLKFAFVKVGSVLSQMALIVWYLISGKLSLSNLAGPIGIFSIVGETAKAGFINVVYLIGFLSLNVGFINIIPFPAFDGGRLLFLIVEKIRGKAIKPEIENRIHNIGFACLILLMLVVSYNDILRLFS